VTDQPAQVFIGYGFSEEWFDKREEMLYDPHLKEIALSKTG
jgi:hypothetical protein